MLIHIMTAFVATDIQASSSCDQLLAAGDEPISRLKEVARNLNKPRYSLLNNLTKSSNKTYIVVDQMTGEKVALYKPDHGVLRDIESIYPVVKKNIALREELAYWLSQYLELSDIAPAIRVDTQTHKGALVLWQDGFKNYYDFWVSHYQSYPTEAIEELEYLTAQKENHKVQELALFDYIIGNLDRNLKNFLINDQKKIIGIDHSISFPIHPYKLSGHINLGWNRGDTAKTAISSQLLSKVEKIDIEDLISQVRQIHPELREEALLLTRERLEIIQYFIREKYPLTLRILSRLIRYHQINYKMMIKSLASKS